MPPAKTVAYVGSNEAVGRVLDGGFAALEPASADQLVVLTEVGPSVRKGADGQAVLLLGVPDDLLSQFEHPTESGGPARAFSISASVADRLPVLAYREEGPGASEGPRRSRRPTAIVLTALLLVGAGVGLYLQTSDDDGGDAPRPPSRAASAPAASAPAASAPAPAERTEARSGQSRADRSRAVGSPTDGRLVNGVPMPAEGEDFFTWNIPDEISPNPRFRRFATVSVVERIQAVIADFRRANPRAGKVGIADLSLPKGGEFGVSFGGTGHVAHRNGTEVDILYPRRDRAERATESPAEVDRRLAQDLLDRFLEAGAIGAVVDPGVGLTGPAEKIQTAPFHEDHMHIRFPPAR